MAKGKKTSLLSAEKRREIVLEEYLKGTSVVNIAKLVGVNRGTIYTDLDREDMKAKLSKAREQNLKNVVDIINIQSSQYINELTKIAMTSKDEKLRADVLKYLLDHSIGKATSKQDINVTTTDKTAQLENIDDILKEIDVEVVDVDVDEEGSM